MSSSPSDRSDSPMRTACSRDGLAGLHRANNTWAELQRVLGSDRYTVFDVLQLGWVAYTAHGWPFGVSREGAGIWMRFGQQSTRN